MMTKEEMIEALNFLKKADSEYRTNPTGTKTLVRNYMMSHKEIDDFIAQKDLVYSGFKKHNWIEADFDAAIRVLKCEIENA